MDFIKNIHPYRNNGTRNQLQIAKKTGYPYLPNSRKPQAQENIHKEDRKQEGKRDETNAVSISDSQSEKARQRTSAAH